MAAVVRRQGATLSQRWQSVTQSHPELWVLAVCAGAWVVLLWPGGIGEHSVTGHHATATGPLRALLKETMVWLVMALAMMLPLMTGPVKAAAARSLWRRRYRATVWVVGGYLLVWAMAGFAVAFIVTMLEVRAWPQPALGVAMLAVAAAWLLAPQRRTFSMACHRALPIAPSGWAADRDCLRYGWLIGERCLGSCLPLMLACVATRHNLLVIAILTVVGLAERYTARPDLRLLAAVPLAAAAAFALMA